MSLLRKSIAYFFASLILVFSATCYSGEEQGITPDRWNGSDELAWVSPATVPGLMLQESTSAQGVPVWRPEVSIPGLFFRSRSTEEPPRLQILRKIFVVDKLSYTPCKSVLLFPFHEFS